MGWFIAALIVLLLILAFRLSRLATRLDRLHRRTEAAWAVLDVALARRAGLAMAVAADPNLEPSVTIAIATAVRRTESAAREHRADAENALTKALEMLRLPAESTVGDELVQAAQRIMLARRFHNDAVRDTRALRADRFSRAFRLAGRATLPDYFEIAEFNPTRPANRLAARVVLVDDQDRVLMFSGTDPLTSDGRFWFTPGGGAEPGEDLIAAAERELEEETGLRLPAAAFIGPIWWRQSQFSFGGLDYDQTEYFFVATLPTSAPPLHTAGFTDLERATIDGHRWWSLADLRSTAERIYPTQFADRLPQALALAQSGWFDADPEQID